jgi:hypothetical protein
VKAVAELIIEPGEDAAAAATMVRGFAQRSLIVVRELKGSGRTAHQQFAMADVLATKVLRSLTLHGIADNAALKAVSEALYSWTEDDHKAGRVKGAHPASAALARFEAGDEWRLQLCSFSHNGERRFTASFLSQLDLFPTTRGVAQATSIIETRSFIARIHTLMYA